MPHRSLRRKAPKASSGSVSITAQEHRRCCRAASRHSARVKAAGLPADLRILDLRHSFASALANAGTPLNEIGTVLGHTQLATTLRYAHHAPQRLIDTATVASRAWNLLPETKQAEAENAAARDAA